MSSTPRSGHSALSGALSLALVALASTSARAQDFADADSAVTNYTAADIAPATSCASLANLKLADVIAISSRTIAADGDVPAHCRVDGTIDPAIVFQINLPIAWNGRYYMVGNGGPAGQHPDTQAAARSQDTGRTRPARSARHVRVSSASRIPG